jgi:phage replication O-like protein O
MHIQPFADDGGYTCFTNYVLDVVMPSLPPNAWKVLCLVIRKTRGWNKEKDRLSYSQIAEGTGIDSDATIRSALKLLIERKFVIANQGSAWKAMAYSLNSALEIEVHDGPDSTLEIEATTEIEVGSTTEIEAHSTLEIEDTKETNLNKKKETNIRAPRKRADAPADQSPHQKIMAAYASSLGYAIRDGPKEGNAAKWLVKNGYTAEQVQACFFHLRSQAFWQDKHISLQTVASQIGAFLQSKNGYRNGSSRPIRQDTGQNPERAQWRTELTDEL